MTGPLLTWRRIVVLAILRSARFAGAVSCYYPNGDLSPAHNDMPCSTQEGAACCPKDWICLDNGLCYYPNNKYFGRYGCADQSWDSPYCPSNLCTYNGTAAGDEAVSQCSNHGGQYCCDGDRVHRDCCNDNSMPFFSLPDGNPYATIGAGSTPSNAPTLATFKGPTDPKDTGKPESPSKSSSPSSARQSSARKSSAQQSSAQQSSAASSSKDSPSSTKDSPSATKESDPSTTSEPTTTAMTTSLQTSISSGTDGVATVIITTSVPVPSQQPSNEDPQKSSSKSKTPVIVGCAVGIPLGLAVIALLFLLLRRRNNNNGKPSGSSSPHSPDPPFTGHTGAEFVGGFTVKPGQQYHHDANTPELDPQSIGPGRPISTINGMAELSSGTGFAPGAVAQAPHLVGVGGGNSRLSTDAPSHTPGSSWGSAPPGYIAENGTANVTGTGYPNDYPPMAVSDGPNVTAGGRYVPYRPPQQPEYQAGLPDIAELPAMKTPPA